MDAVTTLGGKIDAEAASRLAQGWLYETYFKARQSVHGLASMLGARLGKRVRTGPNAPALFLFSRQFELHGEDEPAWDFEEERSKRKENSGEGGVLGNQKSLEKPRASSQCCSEYADFLARFRDIFWLTYRGGFIPMRPPSSFTSDAGWGCMLRSAQMLLAEVLVRHLGASWRQRNPASDAHRNMLRWFLDAPKYFAFYSIHRMTECGRQFGKKPGEWYGPNTVALVLRDLVHSHRLRRNSGDASGEIKSQPRFLEKDYQSICSESSGQDIAVLVTDDSATLYVDETLALCENENEKEEEEEEEQQENVVDKDFCAVENADDPLFNPKSVRQWKSALFIIAPLRLGLDTINEEYIQPLIQALKFPQCVGMIGGKPAHSLYFVGSQGNDLLYLDPHTVQPAATDSECDDEFFPYQDVVNTYHCTCPRLVSAASIDPSLAVGFFCRSSSEFTDLIARLGQLGRHGTPFMAVLPTRPNYDFGDGLSEEEEEEGDGDKVQGQRKSKICGETNHLQEDTFYDACESAAEVATLTSKRDRDTRQKSKKDEFVFL